jgi:hypothetical protein
MAREDKVRDYENMSREELMAIIGEDVDPNMSREDLIMLAMTSDYQD